MTIRIVASTRGTLDELASVDATGLDRLGSELPFTVWAVFFILIFHLNNFAILYLKSGFDFLLLTF